MSSSNHAHGIATRIATRYADFVVRWPAQILVGLLVLGALATWATTRLTIDTNQLDLLSQDLPEVKDVKRIIDMTGGAGYLIVALRSDDEKQMKSVADDVAAMMAADTEHIRYVTYKLPVDFIQQKMVLFLDTQDLIEAKKRITAYLRDQIKRANPFFIEIVKTEPVKLELDDLIAKYSHVAKKTILDEYYISNDRKMVLLMSKPMWDSNELGKTLAYTQQLRAQLDAYSKQKGIKLVEDYKQMGTTGTIAYGFTGSYKLTMDDSEAIKTSIDQITWIAFLSIAVITIIFFRKWAPTAIVLSGTVLGTLLTMGFTWLTVGRLNMVTAMMGAILMGFGVDYGIHCTFRTRIELGAGKPFDVAVRDALINAGRPAMVSAIVTGGSFMMLLVSSFRGFSQFGWLAGCGTVIIGTTLFTWTAALILVIGRKWPDAPKRLIGTLKPKEVSSVTGKELRIPRPGLLLAGCIVVVAAICAFAVPWKSFPLPKDRPPTLAERFLAGVRFDYNTRALLPERAYSVQLNDEINDRFNIAADPIAVYTRDLDETKELWNELSPLDPKRFSSVDQVVGVYTFVPPAERAQANAKVLEEWQDELKDIDVNALPPELQPKAQLFLKILAARPYDVNGVPSVYLTQFQNLPSSKPENKGWLTLIYPQGDLWDGKNVITFADQTSVIRTKAGHEYRAAGLPILYAKLARIVMADAKLTLLLTALWVLMMHYLDFRRPSLALASVIPLVVGLGMMLGMMSMLGERLNFMNIVILPILLGFGVSHGLYLLHRFLEGVSPIVAFESIGAAVASSTLTAIAGFASLFAASHRGLKSMGVVACLGLFTTLVVSFTVLASTLQVLYDRRVKREGKSA